MYLKDMEIAKKVHIVGLNDENIKQWIYFFLNDKSSNRPTKTNFCQIFRKNFVCSRTLRNFSVELVLYHFVNHILTNSTDIVPINSFYRPVCDGLYAAKYPNMELINAEISPKK